MNILVKTFMLFICFLTGIVSCSSEEQDLLDSKPIRVAVLPDQSPARLRTRYMPLINYLATQLKTEIELVIPINYTDLLKRFHQNEFDLVRFGGFSFVKAAHKDGAIPLVMRDIDARFSSYFLVRSDEPGTSLTDFRDKKISFGSRLSTSGHLMPRYFLLSKKINVDEFFASVLFSGAHDKTAYSIRDNVADLGVANALVIEQLYRDGLLSRDKVRILWKTPPYADYVWATSKHMPKKTKIRIQDAFLSLSSNMAEHEAILHQLGAGSYLPANMDDFNSLKDISKQLGLLDDK